MGKYDFDSLPNRKGTSSLKWDVKENELPMWVADMDFFVAPEIRSFLMKKVNEGVYGYSDLPASWAKAYSAYYDEKYGLMFDESNLTFSLGVIPSVSSAVRAFTEKGEKVAVFTPNYHVFYHSITNNERIIAPIELLDSGNSYSIDWEALENVFKEKDVTMFIMSNPHNPSGKIFSKEELEKIAILADRYGVFVLSDEIHGEITEPGYSYVPYFLSSPLAKKNSLTCLSPTKAWNMAGIQTSAVLSFDREVTKKIRFSLNKDEVMEGNFFSYGAAITAYSEGKGWLREMNEYVAENRRIVLKAMEEKMTLLKPYPSHSTYLLWVNFGALKGDGKGFVRFLREKTGLFLSDGAEFSPSTSSFFRMNLATSKSNIEDAMRRLAIGIDLFETK